MATLFKAEIINNHFNIFKYFITYNYVHANTETKHSMAFFSPQANYTSWRTAAGQWILMPTFADISMLHGQRGYSP
jgi:hypothetical protein